MDSERRPVHGEYVPRRIAPLIHQGRQDPYRSRPCYEACRLIAIVIAVVGANSARASFTATSPQSIPASFRRARWRSKADTPILLRVTIGKFALGSARLNQ